MLAAMELMIQDKSLTIKENFGNTPAIQSDPDRIRQVINIVLDNAIKYTHHGGLIQIDISQEKKWVCLSVSNTGDGIAKEDLEKIFDRFYRAESARTSNGSHGLGLSIARTVMRQLGGSITAESVVGQSTTFTMRFPIIK